MRMGIIIVGTVGLVALVGFQSWKLNRAELRATAWQSSAERWARIAHEQVTAMDGYHDLLVAVSTKAAASADDAAVCASMLPAEQRRSFTGQ